MIHVLQISTRDPLIARDGRPFGATQGHRMKSVGWLYPSVAAGMVRTLLGEKKGGKFGPEVIEALKRISINGPLPTKGSQLFFPAPLDLAIQESAVRAIRNRIAWASRPHTMDKDEGTDLPSYLLPVLLPSEAEDFKPAKAPPFWSTDRMTQWLSNSSGAGFEPPPDPDGCTPEGLLALGYLKMEKEERFHVNIEPRTYAARETQLFMTVAIAMAEGVSIALRIETDPAFDSYLLSLDQWTALGGERRMVRVAPIEGTGAWACPSNIRAELAKTNLVRMVLVTPALFKDGWKPGWIGDHGEGEFAGVRLQLLGACVERWKPISGWSYESPRGPKPSLRLAPAGSVYFFQAKGNASSLADQWLKAVSDLGEDGQSRRDGFGLALWGSWTPHQ